MEAAHTGHKGAVGLSVNGRNEMIDAPMLKQVKFLHHTQELLAMVNTTFVVVTGATNHSTCKASRVIHPTLKLIDVNTEISINKAHIETPVSLIAYNYVLQVTGSYIGAYS